MHLLLFVLLVFSTSAWSADAGEFGSLYLVLLKAGDSADKIDDVGLAELQKQHLAHLTKLTEAGNILVAGPFDEQDDDTLRGLCLYRAADKEEVRKLAEADPAVKAGRIQVEVQRWWFHTDRIVFPKDPGVVKTE